MVTPPGYSKSFKEKIKFLLRSFLRQRKEESQVTSLFPSPACQEEQIGAPKSKTRKPWLAKAAASGDGAP